MHGENAPRHDATVTDGTPVDSVTAIVSCSRLGRTANPPTFSLIGWLRPRRRRYSSVSGA